MSVITLHRFFIIKSNKFELHIVGSKLVVNYKVLFTIQISQLFALGVLRGYSFSVAIDITISIRTWTKHVLLTMLHPITTLLPLKHFYSRSELEVLNSKCPNDKLLNTKIFKVIFLLPVFYVLISMIIYLKQKSLNFYMLFLDCNRHFQ